MTSSPPLPAASTLGAVVFYAMAPVNVALVLWIWVGRLVFGVGGWFMVLFFFTLVPIAFVALLVTTILALTQKGPRALTRFQTWAQLGTWVALFGFGAFCPDFGDAPDSEGALLTQVFGDNDTTWTATYVFTFGFAIAATIAYGALLAALTATRRPGHAPPDSPVASLDPRASGHTHPRPLYGPPTPQAGHAPTETQQASWRYPPGSH